MSLFHSLRTMPLLLGCLCLSIQASAEKVEQEGKFLQSLYPFNLKMQVSISESYP
ncbi:hypothetical protein [Vibrio diabolicus]|uniref:hypothetical protein n=1 Tax=Vibrio diabolicus TaxID=50719 RepID=UPI0023300576|nr:hypothetical protein [Vibrio diabolicus]